LFVLRSLKPQELSVGIALLERGVDEGMIPREVGVDLKRELSPLLDVERGETRIFHTYYIRKVLQQWIQTAAPGLDDSILARLCLIYLQCSLREVVQLARSAEQGEYLTAEGDRDGEDEEAEEIWKEEMVRGNSSPPRG
jgi:hypothetical protein